MLKSSGVQRGSSDLNVEVVWRGHASGLDLFALMLGQLLLGDGHAVLTQGDQIVKQSLAELRIWFVRGDVLTNQRGIVVELTVPTEEVEGEGTIVILRRWQSGSNLVLDSVQTERNVHTKNGRESLGQLRAIDATSITGNEAVVCDSVDGWTRTAIEDGLAFDVLVVGEVQTV